jgi:hypothetical protein
MSTLAKLCEERGLASLFKSCMKINDSESNQSIATVDSELNGVETTDTTTLYGALILVHHMNNIGFYSKWLKKTTKSFGCDLLIKHSKHSTDTTEMRSTRNVTVVLLGSEEGVKQVIKLWRASRVDVDAYSRPCLERMMSILTQGPINNVLERKLDFFFHVSQNGKDDFFASFDDLERVLLNIGGASWSSIWSEAIQKNR